MSLNSEDVPVDALRKVRDEQLVKGNFATASSTQNKINARLGGEPDGTATLSAGRDRRLHAEIDDLDELRERRDDAEDWGFMALSEEYDERIAELEGGEESALSEAEETRATLSEPSEDVLKRTEAALSSEDVIEAAERGQAPTQYVFDAYDIDPREYDDEYVLRDDLRGSEPRRLPEQEEEISTARAALSVADRAELDTGGQTAAGLIRERYGLEPSEFEDAEALRDAIVDQGGYNSGIGDANERYYSALSANLDREKNGDSGESGGS